MTHTAYRDDELRELEPLFVEARKAWRILTEHAMKTNPKGHGSIICGDGIAVNYLPPRCRKSVEKIVVSPIGQGCGYYEPYKDFIVGFLKEHGVECHYAYGRMD